MLSLSDKESVEEDDIIFIKDREQIFTPIMKKQRGPLSTGGGEEKKQLKISMSSSSKKKKDEKDDMKEDKVVIAEFVAKKEVVIADFVAETRYGEK